jgi:hypothetical protein
MKNSVIIFFFLLSFNMFGQETSFLCAGTTKTLTASATGGVAPITYTWTSPSAVVTTGATVTANASGTYSWTAEDANGCSASGTHIVTIEANPTASIVVNANNSCVGASQTISATNVPAGYTYSWSFGSGASPATSTSASTSVSYSTSGSKTVALTISRTFTGSTNGCSATCTWNKSATITVGQLQGNSSCN